MKVSHRLHHIGAPLPWWKPLLISALTALLVLFGFGLGRDPSFLPSALIGKPLPAFDLASLGGGDPIRAASLAGKPMIINFWASWCGACRTEHDVLLELGQKLAPAGKVQVLGINFRDTTDNAQRFLNERGAFPYPSASDPAGRTGIDFGVYGLPETFFVAADGKILARHVGALTPQDAEKYLRGMGAGL